MTEIEKWLKMYGNYPVKKTSTSKKDELNERIRRKLNSRPLFKTTPEERLADLKLRTSEEYYPGIHTQTMNLPIYRADKFIQDTILDITSEGGKILNMNTTPSTILGFQTMYVAIVYEMPSWESRL